MPEEEKGIKEEERKRSFDEFLGKIEEVSSTKEERKRVAESYKKYLKSLTKSEREKYLVFLGEDKRKAIKRSEIPRLLAEDPEFYKTYKGLFEEGGK